MSKATKEAILERALNKIIKSQTNTSVAEAHEEIESNYAYINQKQLKRLVELHDAEFKDKCVAPLQKLYYKYSDTVLCDGDLQNWAELIERDIRVLETTLAKARDNQSGE
ncbi:LAQU0S01e02102g1_1 [Lachancea quebecensis]|uniref:LAQU0S01e02102g1_1 n=1 Tax=Lachancea quebecensis TaxID=1654605 RepID=A0A0P1KKX1_9SACH|nr:LAQU0S01e02102g1_1 [Lachancea quebecensis]